MTNSTARVSPAAANSAASARPAVPIREFMMIASAGIIAASAGRAKRSEPTLPSTPSTLSLSERVALPDQLVELVLVFSNAVGVARFVGGAGGRRCLFGQLPDVVAEDGDAVVHFGTR